MALYYYVLIVIYCVLLITFFLKLSDKQLRTKAERKRYLSYLAFFIFVKLITEILILSFDIQSLMFVYPLRSAGDFFILSHLFFYSFTTSKKRKFLIGIMSLLLFLDVIIVWFNNKFLSPTRIFYDLAIVCTIAFLLVKDLKNKYPNLKVIIFPLYCKIKKLGTPNFTPKKRKKLLLTAIKSVNNSNVSFNQINKF